MRSCVRCSDPNVFSKAFEDAIRVKKCIIGEQM